MSLITHAERELKLAGVNKEDSMYNGMLYNAVMELVNCFSKQGHSGMSARITLDLFSKVANYENLTGLTYEDDEFNDNQNTRVSSVFREENDGRFYFLNAITFIDQNGSSFTGNCVELEDGTYIGSSQYIKDKSLPLKKFIVNVIENEDSYVLVDKTQLEEVFNYYDKKEVK